MRVLVTGATGFVGRALVNVLLEEGIQVVGVGRRQGDFPNFTYHAVPDFAAFNGWQPILQGCDVVVHLAARVHVMDEQSTDPLAAFRQVNVDGTLRLASEAAKAGVKRFIYMSSVKVNGECTQPGQPFTEEDTAHPEDAYGLSKLEAEQGLFLIARQTGIAVVIIRPPLVYGDGVKANFASMMRVVKRGIPLPLGAIHNQRSFLYVRNLVSFIRVCMDHPKAANQVFLVSDGRDISTTELLTRCAQVLGVKSRLLPVPQGWLTFCAALLGKGAVAQRLCGNLQLDISKARSRLGWTPPFAVEDGLHETALGLLKGEQK